MKKLNSRVLIISVIVGTCALTANAATKMGMQHNQAELRAMDTSKDSMVSKDEFLAYHETMFNKMKLTNGMISLKGKLDSSTKPADAANPTNPSDDASSMNNKPIGTTTDNPAVNDKDAVNGKTY
ncbi:MAG TPA: hypothetical protein VGD04_07225 [Methylophilus sp.]